MKSPFAARNIPLNATIANTPTEMAELTRVVFMVCSFPIWTSCTFDRARGMPFGEHARPSVVDLCDEMDARPDRLRGFDLP